MPVKALKKRKSVARKPAKRVRIKVAEEVQSARPQHLLDLTMVLALTLIGVSSMAVNALANNF